MSSLISLSFAGLGAVAAAVGAGVLLTRCFRRPRPDLIAWSVALIGLLISLGAQTLGYLGGYDGAIFRAMVIGGLAIAPLAVILGLSEIAAKGLGARFCARVYISSVAVVAVVILYLDQLADGTFTKSWPNPHAFYQSLPSYALYATSLVTLLVTAIAVGIVMARSGQRAWSVASTPQVTAGAAAVMLAYPGLALLARYQFKQSMTLTSVFTPLLAIAAGLILWAALKLEGQDIAALHGRAGSSGRDADDAGGRRGGDDAGSFGRGRDHGGRDDFGRPGDADRWGDAEGGRHGAGARQGGYPGDHTGDFERFDDGGLGVYRGAGLYRPEPGQETRHIAGPDQGDNSYEHDWRDGDRHGDDWEQDGRAGGDRDYRAGARDGYDDGFETGDFDPIHGEPGHEGPGGDADAGRGPDADDHGHDGDVALGGYASRHSDSWQDAPGTGQTARQDLFGQIAIYTLLEDRVHEFDQLTGRVVEDVRSREPDTLVYIVHAVPSAPMQRILYEVYRDRAAYEWHRQQPYVARFEADRRPYVLATNVIELGLQQAKVSPFPSVTELFGEPGFDTSGFERPDYLRDYGRPQASQGDPRGGGRR